MPIAIGVNKQVRVKAEATWGVAPAAGGAQLMRRQTSDLSLKKETYKSNEIRTDYQISDFRHGVRGVEGSIDGELSPLTYQAFLASALRRLYTTVAAVTAVSLTFAASGSLFTVTRAAGDWLTSGLKIGDVVRVTAGAVNAANLNKNMLIVAESATVLTVLVLNGLSLFAEGPIASCTVSLPGRKTWVPVTGHTDESYSIEHWFSDIAQSELFVGCKITQVDVDLPPTGMATIKIGFMGKDATYATAQYFTSPTALTTSGVLAAVNGAIAVNGLAVGLVTALKFTITGNMSSQPVVGSNTYPDIFEGSVEVSGSATVLFQDAVMRDYFTNETEVSMAAGFTTGLAANSDFLAFGIPRVKFGSATKDDGQKGLQQTMEFTALLATTGGSGVAVEQTTLQIHDSLAV